MTTEEKIRDILRLEEHLAKQENILDILKNRELENLKLLERIYHEEKDKRLFVELLIDHTSLEGYLSFDFLIRNDCISEAFVLDMFDEPQQTVSFIYRSLCRLIYLLNNFESVPEDLEEIRVNLEKLEREFPLKHSAYYDGWILENKEIRNLIDEIKKQIDIEKVNIIKKELGGEIFSGDIEVIEKKIGEYNLSLELSKSLDKIKNSKPRDEHDYAIHLATVRSFLEKIVKEVAEKISVYYKEDIPKIKDASEFVKYKSYLKSKSIIDDENCQLLGSIYKNLSAKAGSHGLSTPYEEYRLLLNMSIEEITLILGRVSKFLK